MTQQLQALPNHVGDDVALFLIGFAVVLLFLAAGAALDSFFGGVRKVNSPEDEDDQPSGYADPAQYGGRMRW